MEVMGHVGPEMATMLRLSMVVPVLWLADDSVAFDGFPSAPKHSIFPS